MPHSQPATFEGHGLACGGSLPAASVGMPRPSSSTFPPQALCTRSCSPILRLRFSATLHRNNSSRHCMRHACSFGASLTRPWAATSWDGSHFPCSGAAQPRAHFYAAWLSSTSTPNPAACLPLLLHEHSLPDTTHNTCKRLSLACTAACTCCLIDLLALQA